MSFKMKVLIACEESQRVCIAFRDLGHEAYSCDIIECSGGHPEWHIKGDCLAILNGNCTFKTEDGAEHTISSKWDLIIGHPPCTYLTVTGNRWFNVEKYGEKALKRIEDRKEAAEFFMQIANADCDKIAIENPVGYMNSHFRKPDQIIQPYMFGDPFEKKTCLWLKGLPKLKPTNVVEPPARKEFASGKTMPAWYADAWHLSKEERSKIRSKTFPGFAKAMAEQWSSEDA
jgi:site-specific DNA-cytosine methylase